MWGNQLQQRQRASACERATAQIGDERVLAMMLGDVFGDARGFSEEDKEEENRASVSSRSSPPGTDGRPQERPARTAKEEEEEEKIDVGRLGAGVRVLDDGFIVGGLENGASGYARHGSGSGTTLELDSAKDARMRRRRLSRKVCFLELAPPTKPVDYIPTDTGVVAPDSGPDQTRVRAAVRRSSGWGRVMGCGRLCGLQKRTPRCR
jgi:hypothetical protein